MIKHFNRILASRRKARAAQNNRMKIHRLRLLIDEAIEEMKKPPETAHLKAAKQIN